MDDYNPVDNNSGFQDKDNVSCSGCTLAQSENLKKVLKALDKEAAEAEIAKLKSDYEILRDKYNSMEMCDEKYIIEQLKKLTSMTDTERAHADADDLLCKFLKHLGYTEIVDLYNSIGKWYA